MLYPRQITPETLDINIHLTDETLQRRLLDLHDQLLLPATAWPLRQAFPQRVVAWYWRVRIAWMAHPCTLLNVPAWSRWWQGLPLPIRKRLGIQAECRFLRRLLAARQSQPFRGAVTAAEEAACTVPESLRY